jgi:aminoglycoside phosphotransferase (APT) family kinase protein
MHRWRIRPTAYLGGRRRQHWLVSRGSTQLVLAVSPGDVTYELEVQRHLLRAGWPVPELVGGPVRLADKTWYLAARLPGTPVEEANAQRRRRGHLLAELHASTAQLTDLGQRNGFVLADTLVADRELDASLRAYERLRPTEGRIMRWHLDWARAAFARLDLSRAETLVLHGDFAPWNLLFEGERLSGILDFEASHLNYRVADFALAWRGDQDDVLAGYAEVHTLSDLDWELLVPVFWSWLFMGMPRHISDILEGRSEPHGFDWQINHLLKRSNAIRRRVPRFRHPG